MDITTVVSASRQAAAGVSRRASLLALGAAGLAAALASPFGVEASKKGKKRCTKQKKQCTSQVKASCGQLGGDEQECLDAVLPCCATCNLANGVICVLDFFVNPGGMNGA